jgi:hypothetical protein
MLDVPLLGWIATLGAILALIARDYSRLCFGHERLPGSCNVPACRPERPARRPGPSSGGRICLASASRPGGGREER